MFVLFLNNVFNINQTQKQKITKMKVSTENRRQIAQEIREILYQYHPRNRHIVTCTARDYNKYDTFYITSNTILDRFRSSLPNIEENPLFQSLLTYGFIK